MQFNPELAEIKTYEGGKPIELVMREYGIKEEEIVKLASNENPNGVSPKVVEAVQNSAHKMFMYPDDAMVTLKSGLAKQFGVTQENLIIGAGSDEVINFAIRAKANPTQKVLTAGVTFAMYDIYAKQIAAPVIKTTSQQHDLAEFLALYKANPDIAVIFLCLPNNPLGESLSRAEVYEFIAQVDTETLVVVDGAYQEYASYKDSDYKIDPSDLIATFPNTLYLGTFSKAYGLGGMRVGYGIGAKEVIDTLYKVRPPFNVTTLSLVAATTALEDQAFVNEAVALNFSEMERYETFAKENKIDFIKSYTNFITLIFNENLNSKEVAQLLLKKGIIVRDLTSYGVNAIRITIGTPTQNSKFFETFTKVLTA
ncbi:MAG: histidinol-phosphate transaminase [Epsilonproteobacteria bacterium]|nr:histidinol-phosphate transaminase [Campylobacterota bacterium]